MLITLRGNVIATSGFHHREEGIGGRMCCTNQSFLTGFPYFSHKVKVEKTRVFFNERLFSFLSGKY